MDKLHDQGHHILSVSELDLLKRHLRDIPSESLQAAWEGEKTALTKTIRSLKELLSQADRVAAGVGYFSSLLCLWYFLINSLVNFFLDKKNPF